MASTTLVLVLIPEKQHTAMGYDTWSLQKLLQYNQEAVSAGVAPTWIAIAEVADPKESRRIVENRLETLRKQ